MAISQFPYEIGSTIRARLDAGLLRRDSGAHGLTLTLPKVGGTLSTLTPMGAGGLVTISLNGDPFDLDGPVSVSALLVQLGIDARRVAVEHNLIVLKRSRFDETVLQDGDQVEVVNFVGGG